MLSSVASYFSDFFSQILFLSREHNCRYLIALEGDIPWATQVCLELKAQMSSVLWLGDDAPDSMAQLPMKKARMELGQEWEGVIYNGHNGLDVNAFGAVSGTVIGGGLLVLLIPTLWQEQQTEMPYSIQRLLKLLQSPDVFYFKQQALQFPALPSSSVKIEIAPYCDSDGCRTLEQHHALEAIIKVVTGHRKRPLVITADRGRGKTTVLAIAALKLMKEKKLNIAICAPRFSAVSGLFNFIAACEAIDYSGEHELSVGQGKLVFFSCDQLTATSKVNFDLLMVDEAAAIPVPILNVFLERFSRLVFSSTVHGYEGTGKGFTIKFQSLLAEIMPQWRSCQLIEPIRWCLDDPLERWVFQYLLLSSEVDVRPFYDIQTELIYYEELLQSDLIHDEGLLNAVFGLLVFAHYQTSPSDLIQLLDDESLSLWVAKYKGRIVGCCIALEEGGFSSIEVEHVVLGKRRFKGHLLPQALAAQMGIGLALEQRAFRIQRIVVLDAFQRKNIGQSLLLEAHKKAVQLGLDYLGSSFSASDDLLQFWFNSGYQALRLGLSKDKTSGLHSLLCVFPLSSKALSWLSMAQDFFIKNFHFQLMNTYQYIDWKLALCLWEETLKHQKADFQLNLTEQNPMRQQSLLLYVQGGLGYESVMGYIYEWFVCEVSTFDNNYLSVADILLNEHYAELFSRKVLQNQPWDCICQTMHFSGKKEVELTFREMMKSFYLCSSLQCKLN